MVALLAERTLLRYAAKVRKEPTLPSFCKAAYFWVEDIEGLLVEFERRGTKLKGQIVDKAYGCREIVAIAPDGREIVLGERTDNQTD